MRAAVLAIVAVAGCSSAHAPTIDRTDCRTCHNAPVLTEPPVEPCSATDHATYPSTCASCHGTTAWCPADDRHDRFELTGGHAGWDCADCHLAISYEPPEVTDPAQITCTSCHWHNADRTDPFHLGKGDYTYGPATCLESGCHGDRP